MQCLFYLIFLKFSLQGKLGLQSLQVISFTKLTIDLLLVTCMHVVELDKFWYNGQYLIDQNYKKTKIPKILIAWSDVLLHYSRKIFRNVITLKPYR